jgi:TPR repeat protein
MKTGEELSQSDPQAAKWYAKIVDVSPAAGVRLASLLINSKNIAHDYGRAMHLCRGAASKRYSEGDLCVAYLYRKGLGTPADTEEAIKWYEEAGEIGSRQAELIMGQMYWRGEGVGVDRAEAYFHFYRAARIGGPDVRPLAEQLRQEMNEDEMKRFDKKLRQWHLSPDKVLSFMEERRPQ